MRRYYEFITDPTPNFRKLGFFAWLFMAVSTIETLIVIKVRFPLADMSTTMEKRTSTIHAAALVSA